ncbi:Lecithin retinol acyltransferase [Asanoa hainanensis]|uniref:Lecithin retinol acyltransferase n=1 Tax=Asanoa hainanensis TaxID=560556 RepID=A0A239NW65_9ACTN|nr:lecithin retinol acyltransferase family protein [Asanoa hainanensis]SNT58703.1 Lecithin retinol acyltransferase [Asanoa hainanensis]
MSVYEIRHGDHLVVKRRFAGVVPYTHHGIYVGSRKVIHFTGRTAATATVRKTTIEQFIADSALAVRVYDGKTLKRKETCRRAEEILRTSKAYSYVNNNCEHLATLCKAGESKSHQVDSRVDFVVYGRQSEIAPRFPDSIFNPGFTDVKVLRYRLRN